MRYELVDESVDGGACLDEDDHLTWALELGNELLNRVGGNDVCACDSEGCGKNVVSAKMRLDGDAGGRCGKKKEGFHSPLASFAMKSSTLLVVRL